jgi:membrane protein required for colicin V production
MTFSPLDIGLALIIAVIVVKVTLTGFVTEFFSKAATIVGAVGALFLYGVLTPYVVRFLGANVYPEAIAFLAIFLVLYLIVKGIQQLAGSAFESESMNNLDRALGFFLGVVEGLLVAAVILVAIKMQPWFDISSITRDSFFVRFMGPFLFGGSGIVAHVIHTR